ncbi:MAG: class I SAM-dependent methyltransferase [Candidatus Saccharibacteria bacterium]|nr:class I SAM-dependent methyltransferase [Candidatus Saccharibacteria bacterium]
MDTISKAFEDVDRVEFLPDELKNQSHRDAPLPIGHGQTISQPYTVRKMLEWLDVRRGNIVLDVGFGSGWTTALLSNIVGPKGKVYAVERIPELMKFGKLNVLRFGVRNARFYLSKKNIIGLPERSPFNRILVSASANNLPNELINQLAVGGKLIIPVRNNILEVTKKANGMHEVITHPGFIFVPLV